MSTKSKTLKVYFSSKAFPKDQRSVLALGNFDGVHRAHQAMFQLAVRLAQNKKSLSVAYTFDPHPVKVLSNSSAPAMINTLAQKLELIEHSGIDAVIVEPFDLQFAQLSAQDWFEKIIVKRLHTSTLVAGYDFTFGSHRSGTIETLHQLCDRHSMSCSILPAQLMGETLISSTQIRRLVSAGDVQKASELLGREFFIDGEVIKGAGRGAKLGIPTANLKTDNELLPAAGVYACRVGYEKKSYHAVANLGYNPTFGGKILSIEVHILDFKKDIYGKKLRVHFIQRIREEKQFESAKKLIKQIHADMGKAKKILHDEE